MYASFPHFVVGQQGCAHFSLFQSADLPEPSHDVNTSQLQPIEQRRSVRVGCGRACALAASVSTNSICRSNLPHFVVGQQGYAHFSRFQSAALPEPSQDARISQLQVVEQRRTASRALLASRPCTAGGDFTAECKGCTGAAFDSLANLANLPSKSAMWACNAAMVCVCWAADASLWLTRECACRDRHRFTATLLPRSGLDSPSVVAVAVAAVMQTSSTCAGRIIVRASVCRSLRVCVNNTHHRNFL